MSIVNGFQVGSEVLKYNAEMLENYNTPDFDSTSTYEIGDYVMHLGKLYKCIRTISVADDWDVNDWELAVLSDDVKSLDTAVTNIDNSIANDFQANHLYSSGDIIMHENVLYKCIPTTLQVGTFNPSDWEATTLDYVISNSPDSSIPSGGTTNQYLMKNSDTNYDLKWSKLIEGAENISSGSNSHAEGFHNTASGSYSHVEGSNGTASGLASHAEGQYSTAGGTCSHAEGYHTTASASNSHSEGYYTRASSAYSHAEGQNSTASGSASHAEGSSTRASNTGSHTEGYNTEASGEFSHAEGFETIANHKAQHVFGQYNVADPSTAPASSKGTYVEIVGKGAGNGARSNARTLDWSGNEKLAGNLTINAGTANEVSVSAINTIANNVGNELEDAKESIADTQAVFTGPDTTIYSLKSLPKGTHFWINDHIAVTTVDVSASTAMVEHTNYEFVVVGEELSDSSNLNAKISNGIARDFLESSTYNAGDVVYYNNSLYRFVVTHTGAWNPAHVSQEYSAMSNITRIDNKINNGVASQFSTGTTYAVGDYVYYGATLYKFVNAHTGAWDSNDVESVSLGEEIANLYRMLNT